MEVKSILFVDDEQNILKGLRRSFFDLEDTWNMTYVDSGEAALRAMEEKQHDVVVSDMRMPEMNGADLLDVIKGKYPSTIRFILSGYSDKEMVMKTVKSADQFLTKPCDPQELLTALHTIFKVQALVSNQQVRSMVSEMTELPILPEVYNELVTALNSEKASLKHIATIISHDVSITAKILQLVNSAFFGLRHQNYNLEHAVTFLGVDTLKGIILVESVFSQLSEAEAERFHARSIFKHCLAVGVMARKIAESMGQSPKLVYEASMAGILHDFGKVILLKNMTSVYEQIFKKHISDKKPFYELESMIFDATHAEIGAYLLSLWGLPDQIVKAVCFHHQPEMVISDEFDTKSAVYIANTLVHEVDHEDEALDEDLVVDPSIVVALKIEDKIPEWKKICKEVCGDREAFEGLL